MDAAVALAALSAEGHRLIEAAGDLDAPVPTCAGWTVHDLLAHIGGVHRFATEHVARKATARVPWEDIETAPHGEAVREYAATGLANLLDTLGRTDPAEKMWTWSDRDDAGFWFRRMVHETAAHRFDAESSIDDPSPVDDDQGADGVDERFGTVLPARLRARAAAVPSGSLHLHRTDGGEGEWTVRPDGESAMTLTRGHEKGDAAVRGSGGDLFLAVWGRIPLDRVEVFGDDSVARAWIDLEPGP